MEMQNIYKLWQHNSKGCAALKSNAARVEANLITLQASQRDG